MREAVSLATLDGLEGLSIGNLASALEMSKSGIYAHFGSKQDLQLATVDEAERIFQAEVIEPALAARPDIMDDLVAMYDLRQPDGGALFVAIANHLETLDKAVEVINSTSLLPGEDVALLPGPDRVETYQVARTQADLPAVATR